MTSKTDDRLLVVAHAKVNSLRLILVRSELELAFSEALSQGFFGEAIVAPAF